MQYMAANGTNYTVEFLWGYTIACFNLLCYVCVCVCVCISTDTDCHIQHLKSDDLHSTLYVVCTCCK